MKKELTDEYFFRKTSRAIVHIFVRILEAEILTFFYLLKKIN